MFLSLNQTEGRNVHILKYKHWLLVCVAECVCTVATAPSPIFSLSVSTLLRVALCLHPIGFCIQSTCSGYLKPWRGITSNDLCKRNHRVAVVIPLNHDPSLLL